MVSPVEPRTVDVPPSTLLILPVGDQIVDDSWIGKRRCIAERAEVVLGNLAQDAAHDLARAGLGQTRRELYLVGRSNRSDFLAHMCDEILAQRISALKAGHQRDI